jgi:hypothetical protein
MPACHMITLAERVLSCCCRCLQSLVLDGCNLQNIKLSMPKLKVRSHNHRHYTACAYQQSVPVARLPCLIRRDTRLLLVTA